jgi:hypothetical protein
VFFKYTTFEQPNKITIDNIDEDLSKFSFVGSDITRIRFGGNITWGGKDGFRIIEEEWIDKTQKEKEDDRENVSLALALTVYRNLRENYEFRLRYDEGGKFFTKEMELKRKYRFVRPKMVRDSRQKRMLDGIGFASIFP